jgi:hypothetical protein
VKLAEGEIGDVNEGFVADGSTGAGGGSGSLAPIASPGSTMLRPHALRVVALDEIASSSGGGSSAAVSSAGGSAGPSMTTLLTSPGAAGLPAPVGGSHLGPQRSGHHHPGTRRGGHLASRAASDAAGVLRGVGSSQARDAAGAAAVIGSGLRFVDRDEHVYFWFPLLAGLSELTFDPRYVSCLLRMGPRWYMSIARLSFSATCCTFEIMLLSRHWSCAAVLWGVRSLALPL